MGDAGVLATILLIAGLSLIVVELLVPSFGILGISAFICLVVSAWSAWQAWWESSRYGFFFTYVGFLVVGLPTVFFGTFFLIQHTPLGGIIVLRGPSTDGGSGSGSRARDRMLELVGAFGSAVSPLTPGGMVEVNGQRFHAESFGPVIDPGTPVRVVDSHGSRLVVRPCDPAEASVIAEAEKQRVEDPSSTEVAEPSTDAPRDVVDAEQLDFEVPDNYTAG